MAADSQQCCQGLCQQRHESLGFVFNVRYQDMPDQFIAMLDADILHTKAKARVSSCIALAVVAEPLSVWDLVWLNPLMTTMG